MGLPDLLPWSLMTCKSGDTSGSLKALVRCHESQSQYPGCGRKETIGRVSKRETDVLCLERYLMGYHRLQHRCGVKRLGDPGARIFIG